MRRPARSRDGEARAAHRIGFWLALATAGLTVITFALALTAIPTDIPYPFTSEEIADQWPGDYLRVPMLTQYNPNGVFIAVEELGYLLMSVVFLSLLPVFVRANAVERAIRWLLG